MGWFDTATNDSAGTVDVTAFTRLIPARAEPWQRLQIAYLAKDIAERAVNEGGGLPGDTTRVKVLDDVARYIGAIEGTGGLLIVPDATLDGQDDTSALRTLMVRAVSEYNAVLVGKNTLESARSKIFDDYLSTLKQVGTVVADVADVAVETVKTASNVLVWAAIGAVAIAAMIYAPEVKAIFHRGK